MATTAPTTAVDERLRQTPWIRRVMARPELGAVAGTVLVVIFFAFVARGSGMFSALGIINFLEVSAQLGIIAVAACMLMIGGEFDLSIGSMIGAAGVIIAIPAVHLGWPLWLCILLAFAVACLVGYINGTIVIRTGLPSFIVTLAALFILRGATIGFTRLITGRTQVSGLGPLIEQDWLAPVFHGEVGYGLFKWAAGAGIILARPDGEPFVQGVPMSVIWWLVLTVICAWILLRTRVGNWIFASGGDPVAARNIGVPVARTKIALFMMTSGTAAMMGIITAYELRSIQAKEGIGLEFIFIICAVVGGTLLTGGYGSGVGAPLRAPIFGTGGPGIFFNRVA